MYGGDDSKCPWGFVEYVKGEVGGRGEEAREAPGLCRGASSSREGGAAWYLALCCFPSISTPTPRKRSSRLWAGSLDPPEHLAYCPRGLQTPGTL